MQVYFTIDGAEVLHRKLDFAAKDIGSLRQPMDQIGQNFRKTFDMNFSSRGGEYGGWAPRKPQMSGGRRIDTWPLLEKTGTMRKNFRQRVGNDWVRLFNPTHYFRYHQQGTTKMPARVMMKLRAQDARMVTQTLQRYAIEVLRKRGLR